MTFIWQICHEIIKLIFKQFHLLYAKENQMGMRWKNTDGKKCKLQHLQIWLLDKNLLLTCVIIRKSPHLYVVPFLVSLPSLKKKKKATPWCSFILLQPCLKNRLWDSQVYSLALSVNSYFSIIKLLCSKK